MSYYFDEEDVGQYYADMDERDRILDSKAKTKKTRKKKTNADRIRNMTDEELAKFFHRLLDAHEFADCPFKQNMLCPMSKYGSCTLCAIDWLKQEAEE